MNDRKFAFIICVNDELLFRECRRYINQLVVPDEYEIDLLAICEADSMCEAYNMAMNSTDAKYKIYMHQDVFIRQESFLYEILRLFKENPQVGMIGVVGGTNIPDTGIVFDTWNVGKVDVREPDMAYYMHTDESIKADKKVLAIDGMIMVTQYDLPWREDIFRHFDFYDISQSCEFRRVGYEVLVPYQETPWIIHDCGFAKLENYIADREIFLREYADMLTCHEKREFTYETELESLSLQLQKRMEEMLAQGAWDEAEEILKIYHQMKFKSSGLEMLNIMVKIHQTEMKDCEQSFFFDGCKDFGRMKECYMNVRFALRQMELADKEEEYAELTELIRTGQISYVAIIIIMNHSIVDRYKFLERLEKIYTLSANVQKRKQVRELLAKIEKMPIAYSKGISGKRTMGEKNLG